MSKARGRSGARRNGRQTGIERFFNAYVETALWSTTDNADDSGGEPLDKNYDASDIDKKTLDQMMKDCVAFLEDNAEDIGTDYGSAGHNFWLTRERHGSGFWDAGLEPGPSKRLTDAAHAYGSFDLYVGDDGKIYGQ